MHFINIGFAIVKFCSLFADRFEMKLTQRKVPTERNRIEQRMNFNEQPLVINYN